MKRASYSSNQIFTLIIGSCVNFICATCASLQAPFYPAEAERKGATATEYGLVIGSYELVCFLTSTFFGKIIHKTGSKSMLGIGMVVCSVATALFGFLDLIENRFSFIFFSFVLRIIGALGAAASTVAALSLIGCMFPDSVATVMSNLETFYGLGFIAGPTVGGLLFHIGGFLLPFLFVGILSGIISIFIFLYVPNIFGISESTPGGKLFEAIKIPSIAINTTCTVLFAISEGFLNSTLEPHLRIFQISPIIVSLIFTINGVTYAVASPFVGRLVDKCLQPKYTLIISLVLNIISFTIIGPLPFLQIPSTLFMCIVALCLQGLALAGGNVSTFCDSITSAFEAGYPVDISTYGLLSGIWNSAFCLGAFIGPSVGGFLYDHVGFQHATVFVVVISFILLIVLFAYLINMWVSGEKEIKTNNEEIRKNLGESSDSLFKSSQSILHDTKCGTYNGYEPI